MDHGPKTRMTLAVLRCGENQVEVGEGSQVLDAAESLGVCFGCQAGNCGTCLTEVAEGMENLNDPTENEQLFGIEGRERLMCQCVIRKGEVAIEL